MILAAPLAVMIALLIAPGGAAEDEIMLKPGAYAVEVDLQLPHLGNAGAKKRETICVTDQESHGLRVLSSNNPLGKCPISNIAQDGTRLTFDIVCPGPNAARASAMYTLGPEAFHGRITMDMGGKNMTMTEVQEGLRDGDCAAP